MPLSIILLIASDYLLPPSSPRLTFDRLTFNTILVSTIPISFLISIVLGPAAVFLIRRSSGRLVGHGMATTGVWLSTGTMLLCVLLLAFQWGLTLFYFLWIVGLYLAVVTWWKKRPWFWRVFLCAASVLVVYYAAFEHVPRGDVRENQKVNGIPFKELVGGYYHGDGLGVNCSMTITAEGRFYFTWVGCLGVYDRNKGMVKVTDECIELMPKGKNMRNGFRGTPALFMPIRWSNRVYLVPKDEIVDFCSCVNSGREPRNRPHGRFYLRRMDWEKQVVGRPNLPAEFQEYLLKTSVSGTIVALVDAQTGIINLGSKDGLRNGMTLTAQGKQGFMFSTVRITQAGETNSVVKCKWKDSKLAVGQTVTSKF